MARPAMGVVEVTAEDIEQHVPHDGYRCMISRALTRATGLRWWVTYEGATLKEPGRKGYIRFGTKIGDIAHARDSGHPTEPFTIRIAASWLKAPASEVANAA